MKSETDSAKLPVDHTTLQLHNLLYEKNYYLKAIKACKDFKSKYPDIDLVPEEDFFRDASDELKSDPSLKDDAHKLNLQRLNFELHQVLASIFADLTVLFLKLHLALMFFERIS